MAAKTTVTISPLSLKGQETPLLGSFKRNLAPRSILIKYKMP